MVITEKDILMATEVKIETLQLIYNVFKKYMIQELRFRSPAISLRAGLLPHAEAMINIYRWQFVLLAVKRPSIGI